MSLWHERTVVAAIRGMPEEMARLIKEEVERWGKVVRLTGAKVK